MIKRPVKWMVADWRWKILSLCLAIIVWVAVASEPEMTTVLRVPVQYKDAPIRLEISSDIANTVRLELIGVSGRLKEFSAAPSPVILDFSSVHGPGERTFNIDSGTLSLPKGMQLVRAVPAQLRFVFERQGRRTVPVQIKWSGNPPRGNQIVRVEADPPALQVIGPESRVELVHSVSTDPVNLDTIKDGQPVTTSPYITEPQVRFLHFQPVRVRVILKD